MIAPVQIRNEEVAKDLRELALLTRKSITETVGELVREKLEQARRLKREDMERRMVLIRQLQDEVKKLPVVGPRLTDDDLYDEYGLPR